MNVVCASVPWARWCPIRSSIRWKQSTDSLRLLSEQRLHTAFHSFSSTGLFTLMAHLREPQSMYDRMLSLSWICCRRMTARLTPLVHTFGAHLGGALLFQQFHQFHQLLRSLLPRSAIRVAYHIQTKVSHFQPKLSTTLPPS